MGKISDFQAALEILRDMESKLDMGSGDCVASEGYRERSNAEKYMSDMDNWCVVHATKYLPKRNTDGNMVIETTAMATNFESVPRSTVHTTLNHVVGGHNGGSWGDMPYVILMPYNDVVALNGHPREVSMFDTYFAPNPDTGLILPKSAYLVRPSDENNGDLYTIGEHEATYKTSNFTDDEIQFILNNVDEYSKQRYLDYLFTGELPSDGLVEAYLLYDDELIKQYKNASNKHEFLRNAMAKYRNVILTQFLRDTVVKLVMQENGYKYVKGSDGDNIARAARDIAKQSGLKSDASNKGHSFSLEKNMEEVYCNLMDVLNDLYTNGHNAPDVYRILVVDGWPEDFCLHIAECILKDRPIDCYQFYVDRFISAAKRNDCEYRTVADYSPGLDVTLRRNARLMQNKFIQWIHYIKTKPMYAELKKILAENLPGHKDEMDDYRINRYNMIHGRKM